MIASADQLARIRLLACDVDGVLTDGRLHYEADGERGKTFHVRDGHGIRALQQAGVEVALITARSSAALQRRGADLGIAHVLAGRSDKAAALTEVMTALGVSREETAYVGDDLIDLAALRLAGVAVAVADAVAEVRAQADWITAASGGSGAVREIADAILAARAGHAPRFRVVIPSRYAATRLPGKPLRDIAGRPMVVRVWDRAIEAGAIEVVVACDDPRIVDAVTSAGGTAMLTSAAHPSGTDRIAEIAERRQWASDDVVVNLQGDEPAMPAAAIRQVATRLLRSAGAGISTLATPIVDVAELFDPNAVKVVRDDAGAALYFSRAPIPWSRASFGAARPPALPADAPFLRHLGIYAYRVATLRRLCAAPPSPLERAESLEQLRALAMGIPIAVDILERAPQPGVDTEEDLERMRAAFAAAQP